MAGDRLSELHDLVFARPFGLRASLWSRCHQVVHTRQFTCSEVVTHGPGLRNWSQTVNGCSQRAVVVLHHVFFLFSQLVGSTFVLVHAVVLRGGGMMR